ncbi:putative ATP dependent RNA helicase [Lepidopterella palustris CBS 459.81]|uniref:RNA helicase n=1 Tax=Lepidopterella palustris CBS 459.81 TaxID=1314670 RepID=A0A8E2JFD8_9PEZI|nr:putative ATP dependent RNA helicase [Lepidopterella palustris CBS 459.81]
MKRKLNEDDVPEEVPSTAISNPDPTPSSFDLLEPRILRGIQKEKYSKPTSIQQKAIPLALEGKDILARSKTGSGKTAAYLLPILDRTLRRKAESTYQRCTSALILVPTRELGAQVTRMTESLAAYCGQDILVENLTRREDDKVQRARLAALPDIVIATPGRASANLNSGALSLNSLSHLVIDEADLVLAYGFDEDLKHLASSLPKGIQVMFLSATLNTEVETLKDLFSRDPIILELDEEEKNTGTINQYVVRCAEDEKFLLIYAIFMLKLVKGKTIVFVGDVDRSYRLKLFLEQFGIKSCVLNSELPVASRLHIVEEFNKNVYEILIASDENEVVLGDERPKNKRKEDGPEEDDDQRNSEPKLKENSEPATEGAASKTAQESEISASTNGNQAGRSVEPPKKKRKGPRLDRDYGVSRGIDFKNVSCILNFDLPTTPKSYSHRIGRTARAGKTGTVISFVIPKALYRKHKSTTFPTTQHDEEVLEKITRQQEKKGEPVIPYNFDMKRLDGFRYRLADALKGVTRIAIREARVRELRQEILKSDKLQRHFVENPEDLHHLRHDGESRPARIQPHLKHVPGYLLPGGKKEMADVGFVGINKTDGNRARKARMKDRARGKGRKTGAGRKADPLKTFNAKGRGKK